MKEKIDLKDYKITVKGINDLIEDSGINKDNISDGSHTFSELYKHRSILYVTLCKLLAKENNYYIWRSKKHSDGGDSYEGYFVLGIGKDKGEQITYHILNKYWKDTNFAQTLDKAPDYDEHTSEDVLKRLKTIK